MPMYCPGLMRLVIFSMGQYCFLHKTSNLAIDRWNLMNRVNLSPLLWGPLGFYECERMPYGLTYVLVNFQKIHGVLFGQPSFEIVHHLFR